MQDIRNELPICNRFQYLGWLNTEVDFNFTLIVLFPFLQNNTSTQFLRFFPMHFHFNIHGYMFGSQYRFEKSCLEH